MYQLFLNPALTLNRQFIQKPFFGVDEYQRRKNTEAMIEKAYTTPESVEAKQAEALEKATETQRKLQQQLDEDEKNKGK